MNTNNDQLNKALTILKVISCVSGQGSQQEKINILKSADSPEFRQILKYAFDPLLPTHINKIERIIAVRECNYKRFIDLMEKLISVVAVNNELRAYASDIVYNTNYMSSLNEILEKIVTKKLNIGIGIKSINKALGEEVIFDLEMMKAEDDMRIVESWFNSGEEVYAEFKYDGIRIWGRMENGEVKDLFTYNNNQLPLEFMLTVTEEIESIFPKNYTGIIDGEITGVDRQSVSGLVGKIINGTAYSGIDDNFIFNVFDWERLNILKDKKGKLTYKLRRKVLESIFVRNQSKKVILSESRKVNNMDELMSYFNELIAAGYEGVVVKCGSCVYEARRSKSWVKIKAVRECDLLITDIFPGEKGTKREYTIGGFKCQSQDGLIIVKVGSGFKDEQLEEIAKNIKRFGKDFYVGKVVSVKYNSRIKEKSGQYSLFLPRLSEIRIDKTKADIFTQIKA